MTPSKHGRRCFELRFAAAIRAEVPQEPELSRCAPARLPTNNAQQNIHMEIEPDSGFLQY